MHSINKLQNIQKISLDFLNMHNQIKKIVDACDRVGGKVLLVGGAVRDLLLGLPVKDYDIEIHKIPVHEVEKLLSRFGHVRLVGKQFGVFKIDGLDADFSLPRSDGSGRKPTVIVDHTLSYYEAFGRRDLTINAMGIDLITGEVIDPYNGRKDLEDKILRAPRPEFFTQDPLRFFRVVQFIGRFSMVPETSFEQFLQNMSLEEISIERIHGEYEKLFLLSERPSLGLRWIRKIGRIKELLPELAATIDVPQRSDWHPEGDVFEHTMQAVDAAAEIARVENLDKENKITLVIAAVCHDLGKVTATRFHEGQWRSWGHEVEGVEPAKKLLVRLTAVESIKKAVIKLVRYHMMPAALIQNNAKSGAYKRLAVNLAPEVTSYQLSLLAQADKRGRNHLSHIPLEIPMSKDVMPFAAKIKELGLLNGPEKQILQGSDLLEICSPGPALGKLLQAAYTIQIEESITDKEELKRRILVKRR